MIVHCITSAAQHCWTQHHCQRTAVTWSQICIRDTVRIELFLKCIIIYVPSLHDEFRSKYFTLLMLNRGDLMIDFRRIWRNETVSNGHVFLLNDGREVYLRNDGHEMCLKSDERKVLSRKQSRAASLRNVPRPPSKPET
jgi:hypothetical protein